MDIAGAWLIYFAVFAVASWVLGTNSGHYGNKKLFWIALIFIAVWTLPLTVQAYSMVVAA